MGMTMTSKASSPPAKEAVMTQNVVRQEVLTLKEAARYLRLPPARLKKYASAATFPDASSARNGAS